MFPDPTPSDLRFEIAERQLRASRPAPPKRSRRTDQERIADLQTRVDALKARTARPKSVAERPSAKAKRPRQVASEEPLDEELRELVERFVTALHAHFRKRTIARARATFDAPD